MKSSSGVGVRIGGLFVFGALVLAAWLPAIGQVSSASGQASRFPRTTDGKPDFGGIWQARNSAYADLEDHPARLLGDKKSARMFHPAGLSVIDGKDIPYRPEALAKKREHFLKQEVMDPMVSCRMAGVPRVMYLPMPFQIHQTPTQLSLVSEYTRSMRLIYTNGTKHPGDLEFWMGDSRGRWEGDTLVVDVTNFTPNTWLDMAGNYHSEALRVSERLTLLDANTITYEATLEDPKVFLRPWKISMPLYRVDASDRPELLEYECANLLAEAEGLQINPSEEPGPKGNAIR